MPVVLDPGTPIALSSFKNRKTYRFRATFVNSREKTTWTRDFERRQDAADYFQIHTAAISHMSRNKSGSIGSTRYPDVRMVSFLKLSEPYCVVE
jgi:hypothetical protein